MNTVLNRWINLPQENTSIEIIYKCVFKREGVEDHSYIHLNNQWIHRITQINEAFRLPYRRPWRYLPVEL